MATAPQRVLLKLSGETLADDSRSGVSGNVLKQLATEIAAVSKDTQLAITIGGGNLWRYADNQTLPIERATSDQMGMLASVMNAMALSSAIEHVGGTCRVQSAYSIPQVAELYIRRRAIRHLEKGRIVIFAAGMGQPYFTTDTGAATRALEIGADVLLKGTKVDGVYSADPQTDQSATKFDEISYADVLAKRLKVMDATAISLCQENDLPIVVFNVMDVSQLKAAVAGKPVGTKVAA